MLPGGVVKLLLDVWVGAAVPPQAPHTSASAAATAAPTERARVRRTRLVIAPVLSSPSAECGTVDRSGRALGGERGSGPLPLHPTPRRLPTLARPIATNPPTETEPMEQPAIPSLPMMASSPGLDPSSEIYKMLLKER